MEFYFFVAVTVVLLLALCYALGRISGQKERIAFYAEYVKELESKLAQKDAELSEKIFQASVLEAKINQIDSVLGKTEPQARQKVKPFLLSYEASNNGTR